MEAKNPVHTKEIDVSFENLVEEKIDTRNISPYKGRFKDAIWFDKLRTTTVMLLGSGGIGSNTLFMLARIGCPIVVFDNDVVDDTNIGGQLFSTDKIGKLKTEAIIEICKAFSGNESEIYPEGRYTESSYTNPVVIAAFDNMNSRKLSFNKWAEYVIGCNEEQKKECIFIDGRLSAENYHIFCVLPGREDKYRETLFEDSEVEDLPCTLKSTTHCSMGIASDIVSILTNFMTNLVLEDDVREVPFSISKSIQSFTYIVN